MDDSKVAHGLSNLAVFLWPLAVRDWGSLNISWPTRIVGCTVNESLRKKSSSQRSLLLDLLHGE